MLDEIRLKRLASAYFDRQLSREEKYELEEILRNSSKARRIFLDEAGWHGLLREWALGKISPDVLEGTGMVPFPETKVSKSGRIFPWAAGIAACIALALLVLHFTGERDVPQTVETGGSAEEGAVALLGLANDIEWEAGETSHKVGSALPKGWLHIRKGTLRLDFYSGASVFLQGPVSMELISQDLARLGRGRLTATVPPPAVGFTILSGNLRVVDRGTEFGMNMVAAGNCEVHVFKGEVELQGDVPVSATSMLREGNAIAIRDGRAIRIPVNRESFPDAAAQLDAAAAESEALSESQQKRTENFRATPDLLVYYDFENLQPGAPGVPNLALHTPPESAAAIISCDRLPGRWNGRTAMGFANSSDRIRFRLAGETPSLTMMAWIRVDSLPFDHNSLFSMSPEQVGEIHWKLNKSGALLVGVRASMNARFESWNRLESPPVVGERDFGKWMHIATVIDGKAGTMKHFLNGKEVATGSIGQPTALRLGLANLGNSQASSPKLREEDVGRSFNGRMDEFSLIGRALGPEEIRGSMH